MELDPDGKYLIQQELATGGMGRVLKAHDQKLDRQVALKTIRPELAQDPEHVQRFLAEARYTGQLDHPNIVPVHDLGTDAEGRPYFTMKLVEGESLEHLIGRLAAGDPATHQKFSMLRRIQIAQEICRAVSYAHSRGVYHRDLKPANIMVGPFNEVLVLDWGMAEDSAEQSDDPSFLGTVGYAAPEYLQGAPASTATEVYSLGALFYELLALRPAYRAESLNKLLLSVLQTDPPSPDSFQDPIQGRVPRELANVINRAMSRQPAERHAGVDELEGALQEYLDGQAPVVCLTTGLKRGTRRIAQFVDNHPIGAGLTAVAAVSLPLLEAVMIWALW